MNVSESNKTVYLVAGPTAVGKTSFAIKLAKFLNCEIISADSRQFYKEMRIGTAVPSKEELAEVKHHFIQHMSIHEPYNVHSFELDALAKIEELFISNDKVVIVGGSGLYLNALAYGIDNLPDPSPEIRQKLDTLYNEDGILALQKLLLELDPQFYNTVDLNNHKRLMRALEVCLTTGKPYSEQRLGKKKARQFNMKWIGLRQVRSDLYSRINKRVDLMLEEGLINEVKGLEKYQKLNALNTVGYREFFMWLNEEESYEWAVEKVKTNSRRFAKRQMTWFTKNEDITWFDSKELQSADWQKKILDI